MYDIAVTATDPLSNVGTDGTTNELTVDTALAGVLVVDTTNDVADGDTSSITALLADRGADGLISLREAIIATNNTANGASPDEIHFDIDEPLIGGVHTITVAAGGLPAITDAVDIDATTEPDYAASPVVRIDGVSTGGSVDGLRLTNSSDGSTVRGLAIVRFAGSGIRIDVGADGITIADNWIGSDGSGAAAMGNSNDGIELRGAMATIDGNVINNNGDNGIEIRGGSATNNVVTDNIIGLEADGSTGSGNAGAGIAILANASANTIGGTAAGEGNLIAANQQNGISVRNGVNNAILGNRIHSNGQLGIDLGDDGITTNDPGDIDLGGNDLQNFPVLTSVVTNGTGSVLIAGTINSTASTDLRIEFFASTTADGSGHGEAERFIGYVDVTTDSAGNASFNLLLAATVSGGEFVTATATIDLGGSYGSSSEFAANFVATLDAAPVVTVDALSTSDSTPPLTGTVDDPTAVIQVTVDGNTYAATNNGDGTWTLADDTIAPALADGTYDVAVTATDPFSNVGVDGTTDELVVSTNTPPVANPDAYSVQENGSLTTVAGVDDVLQNDTDADIDPLTVNTTPVVGPANGTLTLNADGSFTYTPDPGFAGTDTFTYEISDGNGGLAQALVTINVTPVNGAPVTAPDAYSIGEDGNLVVGAAAGVLNNDLEPDGDAMTVNTAPVVSPTNGVLIIAADGSFTYSPDPDFNGTDGFVYEVSDGNGGLAQASVAIDVIAINDAPVANSDSVLAPSGAPLAISGTDLVGNDVDADGETLTIVSFTLPTFGSLVDDGSGNYVYTADSGFAGIDSFSYTVADPSGATATALVVVDVTAGSGAPPGSTPTPPADEDVAEQLDDAPQTAPAEDDAPNAATASGQEPAPAAADVLFSDAGLTAHSGKSPLDSVGVLSTGGPRLMADLPGDEGRRDAAGIPAKYLYDELSALVEGFEFQGFGLKSVNLNQEALWQALDNMKREMRDLGEDGGDTAAVITKVAAGTSLALSAGFISWVLRGGALASTLLSTMPMWKGFDPLPLLAARRSKRRDDDNETRRLKDGNWSKAIKAERMFFAADSGDGQYAPRDPGSAADDEQS